MLELAEIYGSGQKAGKAKCRVCTCARCVCARVHAFSGLLTRTVYVRTIRLAEIYVRQTNRKYVRTRTVYFCTIELAEIYGSGQATGKVCPAV